MINLERIKTIYKLGKDLSLNDIKVLIKATKKKSYQVGESIIKEGSTERDAYFIIKGLVRCYKKSKKGDLITTLLKWENQVFICHDTVFFDRPSQFYFEALEPTEILSMNYDVANDILSRNPKLETNARVAIIEILRDFKEKVDSFILLNPEERYLEFIQSHGAILNRVPDKYIAHLLGITPVSLSRIRQRITNNKK